MPYVITQDASGTHSSFETSRATSVNCGATGQGSIFSAGGEIAVPTGNSAIGTGGESTVSNLRSVWADSPERQLAHVHSGSNCPFIRIKRTRLLPHRLGRRTATEKGRAAAGRLAEFIYDRDLVSSAPTRASSRKSKYRSASACTFCRLLNSIPGE